MANTAEVMGRVVNKLADSRENPKNFPTVKETGRRWGSIAGAGLTIIGLGAVVFNAVLDFFYPAPQQAQQKRPQEGNKGEQQGRYRH